MYFLPPLYHNTAGLHTPLSENRLRSAWKHLNDLPMKVLQPEQPPLAEQLKRNEYFRGSPMALSEILQAGLLTGFFGKAEYFGLQV